jgi:type I restriction enzyme S subunit
MGQDVCLITSSTEDQRFLTYVLNTVGTDQLERAKVGSTFSRLNVAQIGSLLVPVSSPREQTAIADRLDAHHKTVDRAMKAHRDEIELFIERRQALITTAVTGGLDTSRVAV